MIVEPFADDQLKDNLIRWAVYYSFRRCCARPARGHRKLDCAGAQAGEARIRGCNLGWLPSLSPCDETPFNRLRSSAMICPPE